MISFKVFKQVLGQRVVTLSNGNTVAQIVGGPTAGMTTEEVMREFDITSKDVRAALAGVAELIDSEEFHPSPFALERDGSHKKEKRAWDVRCGMWDVGCGRLNLLRVLVALCEASPAFKRSHRYEESAHCSRPTAHGTKDQMPGGVI